MIAIGFVVIAVGSLIVGYFLGRHSNQDPQIRMYREHAKLLRKARNASIMRKDGLANIYSEAAQRVLENK